MVSIGVVAVVAKTNPTEAIRNTMIAQLDGKLALGVTQGVRNLFF